MKFKAFMNSQWLTLEEIRSEIPDMEWHEVEACVLYFVHEGYMEQKLINGKMRYRRTSKLPPFELDRLK